ncbi:hypothetical protein [Mycolicibacterium sp. ND9-15]|uniref:hypothetical protein n=1 Tax=Mycolicibacterium sp. ND9-15 TaxID=3042320 RepID=UPI003FA3D3CF
MAQKVTAMDIRMASALAGQVDNVAQFCRDSAISRQTYYKFRKRFRDGGIERFCGCGTIAPRRVKICHTVDTDGTAIPSRCNDHTIDCAP